MGQGLTVALARGARPPAEAGLRVPCDCPRQQRARSHPGRSRARPPGEHALISLLALNGLCVSEGTGADSEHLGLERSHRTLIVTR